MIQGRTYQLAIWGRYGVVKGDYDTVMPEIAICPALLTTEVPKERFVKVREPYSLMGVDTAMGVAAGKRSVGAVSTPNKEPAVFWRHPVNRRFNLDPLRDHRRIAKCTFVVWARRCARHSRLLFSRVKNSVMVFVNYTSLRNLRCVVILVDTKRPTRRLRRNNAIKNGTIVVDVERTKRRGPTDNFSALIRGNVKRTGAEPHWDPARHLTLRLLSLAVSRP